MIGLVARFFLGNSPGVCYKFCMPIIAVVALCGFWKLCCKCEIRRYGCIKRLCRTCGVDGFDDFEVMILVHGVKYSSRSKGPTRVKVTAGEMVVETDLADEGNYQSHLCILVEQGTEFVEFAMLDHRNRVLAFFRMSVLKEILEKDVPKVFREKTFGMKQMQKQIISPKIILTMAPADMADEENALLSGINASVEGAFHLTQHMHKAISSDPCNDLVDGSSPSAPNKSLSELELLALSCGGPLEKYTPMGGKKSCYITMVGPPIKNKMMLCIYDNLTHFQAGHPPNQEIPCLKIASVVADPRRPEVFSVDYLTEKKAKTHIKFCRVDRNRDVWVEMLQLLLTKVHSEYAQKQKQKRSRS